MAHGVAGRLICRAPGCYRRGAGGSRARPPLLCWAACPLFGRKKTEASASVPGAYEPLPPPPDPDATGLRIMAAHRDYLLGCVDELPPFSQHILDALDLSLCEDIVSTVDLPRFDNSAMDGYAVRVADVADAESGHPGQPARGGRGRRRRSAPAPAVPGHGDEDHDRRAGARPPTRSCRTRTPTAAPTTSRSRAQRTRPAHPPGRGGHPGGRPAVSRRRPARTARHRRARRDRPGQGAGPAAAARRGDLDRL